MKERKMVKANTMERWGEIITLLEEIIVLRNELELKNSQLSKISKLMQEYERGIK